MRAAPEVVVNAVLRLLTSGRLHSLGRCKEGFGTKGTLTP
jgi:hypothetical protein